ncbi:MAG: type II toxin-antitoxin system Phd/YefM family antitoxin [Deltaproteobacteria bacterium]|nr:type II toxin-antitoxin system Phd/YefM family antitoxin [Deltaproteobacteria bacterium]
MASIKTVGVKALKNHLSAYVRDARAGARILITDRDEVVAEMHEPELTSPLSRGDPLLLQWIRDEKVRPPRHRKKKPLPSSPLRMADGTALRLLNEDRGE